MSKIEKRVTESVRQYLIDRGIRGYFRMKYKGKDATYDGYRVRVYSTIGAFTPIDVLTDGLMVVMQVVES